MAWEERYGGIWYLALREGERVLWERYLPDRDLVALIVEKADGNLSVSILSKGHDPQWRLPFWNYADVPALVATVAEADSYFEAWLCKPRIPMSASGR